MKLIKALLATTITLAAASTFAASAHHAKKAAPVEDKVVVSTQEQPEAQGQATTDANVNAEAAGTTAPVSAPATN